mgnify:FL=1
MYCLANEHAESTRAEPTWYPTQSTKNTGAYEDL